MVRGLAWLPHDYPGALWLDGAERRLHVAEHVALCVITRSWLSAQLVTPARRHLART